MPIGVINHIYLYKKIVLFYYEEMMTNDLFEFGFLHFMFAFIF